MAENEMFRNTGNGMNGNNRSSNGRNNRANGDFGIMTPIAPEGGEPVAPIGPPEHIPTPPIAPEGGAPVGPPEHVPTPPIAPEGGMPVAPIFPTPSFPSLPTFPSFPVFPSLPTLPSIRPMGQVRFLNASTNSFPVNISIDNTTYATNSRFGTISDYDQVADGFHTVTVRSATGPRAILLQQSFPFVAGKKVTMVLTDSTLGGLSMVQVSDTGCTNLPNGTGCYRVANMSYPGSSYDILLQGGQTVFRNVSFQRVAPYKQAMAGSYRFYVTDSSNLTVVREIPIIVIGTYPASGMINQPLISYQADIAAGRNYTTYLIGNTWSDQSLRAMTVED